MQAQQTATQFFDTLAQKGFILDDQYRSAIETRIAQIINYRPTVGVFGKTGAGKSSLCNALFGQAICPISNIEACTRTPQEVELGFGKGGITLLDVPGVGESNERDREYEALYRSLLPKLDLVLWVLKGDDRAYASDETFYKNIVRPYIEAGIPFFLVVNQVDKIDPMYDWDRDANKPGAQQASNIERKRHVVAGFFDVPLSTVHMVSADAQYGLIELVDATIHALPREKRVAVLREVRKEHRSEKAREEASSGFLDTVIDFVVDVVPFIPKSTAKVVKSAVSSVVKWIKEWF